MSAQLQVGGMSTLTWTVKNQAGTAVDISSATITLYLHRPDNSVVVKTTADGVTGDAAGLLSYPCEAGVLNKPGALIAQAKIVSSGNTFPTDQRAYTIMPNLYG